MTKEKFRKSMAGIIAGVICLSGFSTFAKEALSTIQVKYNNIKLSVNGNEATIEESAEPFVYQGKTYVPLEDLAKSLGYNVERNENGSQINLSNNMGQTQKPVEIGLTQEKEDNDTYINANTMKLNDVLTGELGFKDDKGKTDDYDWYKVNIPKAGNLSLEFVGAADLGATISLRAEDGSYSIDYTSGTNKKLLLDERLEAGTFYVVVRRDSKSGKYTLTNKYKPLQIIGDTEINNSFQNAMPYKLNTNQAGYIGYYNQDGTRDGEDWYKFTLVKNQKVNITLSPSVDLGVTLSLYPDDASRSIDYTSGSNKNLKLTQQLAKGTYYIRVRRDSKAGSYTIMTN